MLDIYQCMPMEWGGFPDQINTVGGLLVTSTAGGRPDPITGQPGWHGGEDLVPKLSISTILYAVVTGRLFQSWDIGGGGNWSRLEAVNSPDVFGYGHAASSLINKLQPYGTFTYGQVVEAGTPIAIIGTSGHSTGIHLHFAHKASAGSAWGDPHPALLRTARANLYPGSARPEPAPPTTTPKPPEEEEEEDDMPKAPRPCYQSNTDGAVFGVNAKGELVYAGGPDSVQKLTTPNQGHPAELQPPVSVSPETLDVLKTFYNG